MKKPTLDYITERTTYLMDFHYQRKTEQETDQKYKDDNFIPELLKSKQSLVQHTGEASRLIDAPAEHIITENPQAFREPRTLKEVEPCARVTKLLNHWIQRVRRQNPNPFKECPKNSLSRGENWKQVILNENWRSSNQIGMPIWFKIPDPLTIFASPDEYDGVPEELIVSYKRHYSSVLSEFPDWGNPKGRSEGEKDKLVDWLEYWRKDYRYFEADKEPVLKGGIQENVLGFVPFVHAYSGFGKSSQDGKPESLVVSRIRHIRPILEEDCAVTSDIISLIHRHAYPTIFLSQAPGVNYDEATLEKIKSTIDMSPNSINILPSGITIIPPPNMLESLQPLLILQANIRGRLNRELAPALEGAGVDVTGRAIDFKTTNAMRRYDTIVENDEISWAIAFGMGLRILDTIPDMMPITVRATGIEKDSKGTEHNIRQEELVTKKDIGGYYDCEIKLKAADAIEADRKAQEKKQGWEVGLFSTETTLVEGYGYTPDKAQDEIIKRAVDEATVLNPIWRQAMGIAAAKESGMAEYLPEIPPPTENKKGRPSEVETPLGREQIDLAQTQRGIRPSPRM